MLTAAALIAYSCQATAQASNLSSAELITLTRAFQTAQLGKWDKALSITDTVSSKLGKKLMWWLYLTEPNQNVPVDKLASFIQKNPNWPNLRKIRISAENRLWTRSDSKTEEVLSWYALYPPITAVGQTHLAEAKIDSGSLIEGEALLREIWISGNLSSRLEERLVTRHSSVLHTKDHVLRLENLLWKKHIRSAKRMLKRVDKDQKTLALARIGLMEFAGNVDTLISRVNPETKDDLGLVFDRVRWRRVKGLNTNARKLLLATPNPPQRQKIWWKERRIQVRQALVDGDITDAYQLAFQHGMKRGGKDYAEAEWLAGWIALRFLHDGQNALYHFSELHKAVYRPISRARAAYWAGRAAQSLKENRVASIWYEEASSYPLTFYGQLAAQNLDRKNSIRLPSTLLPSHSEMKEFQKNELTRATRLLTKLGGKRKIKPFLMKLDKTAKTSRQRLLVALLAEQSGRLDLSVGLAKRDHNSGLNLISHAYPIISLPKKFVKDEALLLAVARQESQFNPLAISHAGAVGLMQIMPTTARLTAKRIGVTYRLDRLAHDGYYNAMFGSAHLAKLLDRYEGNYVLTITAYNAGAGRVRRWIAKNGDPRSREVDTIDWIEMIPFEETRSYVQRVLENLQVYRRLLARPAQVSIRLAQDLGM